MALTNEQYQSLIAVYDQRRLRNLAEQDARRREVYEKCPELEDIHKALVSNATARARAKILHNDALFNELAAESEELKDRQEELFGMAGYPSDYLELKYHCPDCRDTGLIEGEKCHCFRQAAIDLLYDQSNIREILQKESFENLSMDYYSREMTAGGRSQYEYMADRIVSCQSFIKNFDTDHRSLLFYGPTGVGKTFLSDCIARELIDAGHSVVYFTAISLFDLFSKSTFGSDEDKKNTDTNIVVEADLLVIDDLGTELVNSFTTGMLFYVINERLTRGKSTIISTNLNPEELADVYTERIASRIISGYELIELYGDDLRIRKTLERF